VTLNGLLADLYRRLDYTATPPPAVVTRLTSFINTTHRQLLGAPGMETLRDDTITFASVANQATYGLPPIITRIESITDRTTTLRLREGTLDEIRSSDPGLVQTGPPDQYISRGYQQVAIQPTAAAEIFVKSTSLSDTTQVAYIEGTRTGGYRVALSVMLTGTTAVTLGAAYTDIVEVTKAYLSSAAVGTVTFHQTSGAGAELARIPIGARFSRYLGIQLYPTPVSVITYYVDYVRTIPDLIASADEPLLPEDFHYLLVEGTLLKEWTKRDDSRRGVSEKDYARGVSALKYFINCAPDFLPSRRQRQMERSRFGAYFGVTRD
jgi:hypothetical protein